MIATALWVTLYVGLGIASGVLGTRFLLDLRRDAATAREEDEIAETEDALAAAYIAIMSATYDLTRTGSMV